LRYYIIAGEASGDLHASNLMKAIIKEDGHSEFRFWGGDLMAGVGGTLVKHYRDLAFMGFAEVIMNLRTILGNIKFCKKDIESYAPDAIILVDYPGFNLRIAEFAKKKGITVHYYISPQIWAWKENRINKIKRDIDHMYVILPFEKQFYEEKHDYPVHFVGHPLLDAIADRPEVRPKAFAREHGLSDKPIVALLPGSRKQEITKMLGVMLAVVDKFPDHQFVIAGAPSQELEFYRQFIKLENVSIVQNRTYDLLSVANAALVTSGTATLETALFKVPEVVCYKGNAISYQIGKRLVQVEYISLVNLILNREVVKELIQDDFNEKSLEDELFRILDHKHREGILDDYFELEKKLGGKGASENTAKLIIQNS
jgi:lipid-A-disaccharide synthase